MHILVIPSWLGTSGYKVEGIFFREQAKALAACGHQVGMIYPEMRRVACCIRPYLRRSPFENRFQIVASKDGDINILLMKGWKPPLSKRLSLMMWVYQAERLYKYYSKTFGAPDVIHAHSVFNAGFAASRIWRRFRCPYVVTEHLSRLLLGIDNPMERAIADQALGDAGRVVAVSNALRAVLIAHRSGGDIDVVPNMVDTDYFKPYPSANEGFYKVLSVGMLKDRKRFDILIKAFALAFDNTDNARLEIGGEGEERERLANLVVQQGLQGRVVFLGELSKEGVRAAMNRASLFVLSSAKETFGVVLIEALAMKLPVIATRCGGPVDILDSGLGALVNVDDVSELAEQMQRCYQNRAVEAGLGDLRRDVVKERYTPKVVASQLTEIFQSVTSAQE